MSCIDPNFFKKEFEELKKLTLLGVKNVLTMDDVRLITGYSKSHLYKLTMTNKIPHYKQGISLFFDKKEIENWCKSIKVLTDEELKMRANETLAMKGGLR